MIGICIEASHSRGLGHLYRAINLCEYFDSKSEKYIVFVNDNEIAKNILKNKNIPYDITNYEDELELIKKYSIKIWINDRLEIPLKQAQNIKQSGCTLITFDDNGKGSELADLNFSPLLKNTKSKKNFNSVEYLILNKEIKNYRKLRNNDGTKTIVAMGGSDTYGLTIYVVNALKELKKSATIILGPSFEHKKELNEILTDDFVVKQNVPSLIEEFSHYDIAITAGGITPFEANASGLPCIIIATEPWEIDNAKILENLGSSIYAGYRENFDKNIFKTKLHCDKMSKIGIEKFNLNAVDLIYKELKKYD